jgi:hypothetical protein
MSGAVSLTTNYRWQISYEFDPAIPYAGRATSFPTERLTVEVGDTGIRGLTHYVDLVDDASEDRALGKSWRQVGGFIAALRFLQAKPVSWRAYPTLLEPQRPGKFPSLRVKGTAETGPRALTTIPTLGWQAGADSRLSVWLNLAAEAQEAPSSATAFRLYALILEDIDHANPGIFGPTYECLKAVRDFLSHPAITQRATVARLSNCAPTLANSQGLFTYNPHDSAQRRVLDSLRASARTLVEKELRGLMGLRR